MTLITRDPGVPTGYAGIVAGGGYRGATEDLDALVNRAAELLRDEYRMDVTIRFNSNRMSGGAWLVTDEVDGFSRNADVGITAILIRVDELKRLYSGVEDVPGYGRFEDRLRKDGIDPANPPSSYLLTFAHIGNASLSDPCIANCNAGEPDRRYALVQVSSIEDALVYLHAKAVLPERVRLRTSDGAAGI